MSALSSSACSNASAVSQRSGPTVQPRKPRVRIRNLRLSPDLDCGVLRTWDISSARCAATLALKGWYKTGSRDAMRQTISILSCQEIRRRNMQNLERWPCCEIRQRIMHNRNDAYVMLYHQWAGNEEPVILHLNHDPCRGGPGSLSRRELHGQLRAHLRLESKHSLRICLERPWYRYWTQRCPVPEEHAIPADDGSSSSYWGMTLRYFHYTHLRE